MAKPIKITIRGTDARGTDAPTVEDLLSQIQDFVTLLHGVEGALAEDGQIEWRVTDASRNSPLTLEMTPYSRDHAVNIDRRAGDVVRATSAGFAALSKGVERPMYFSDAIMTRAENIFERVTNGLAETVVDTSQYEGAEPIRLTEEYARPAVRLFAERKKTKALKYRELGSVEGFISKVELDGYKRPIVWLRHRIDGQSVKCIAKGNALDRIGHYEVAEVLKDLRVQVFGIIHYKDLEKIESVEVDAVHVFPPDCDLPDFDDIVDPDFTGGTEAAEYLRNLRQDD